MTAGTQRRRVHVVTWFYDDQPGFLDFRYRIESLARRHDVTLVLRRGAFAREFPGADLRVCVVDEPATGTRSLLRYQWRVAKLVRYERPDAVVLLGAQLAFAVPVLGGVPTALYWNEHPTHAFHSRRRNPLSQAFNGLLVAASFWAARRANVVMPIGEAHRDDLLAHAVDRSRCEMIYMGVHERFVAAPRAPAAPGGREPLRLIYTGTVEQDRGRDVMLEAVAMARAHGAECRLRLVGASDAQKHHCLRLAQSLGIADAVQVEGRVAGDAIPRLLNEADAGLCIWRDRIWWRFNPPTKLFEYLVAGLPVLASRIRTHTDYVTDGVEGLVFDYDARALAAAIVRLAENRDLLPHLSAAAALSGERFRWASIEPQFLAVVDRLMTPDSSRILAAHTSK